MKRFTQAAPFDPSITQEVRNALHDAGRGDLADGMLLDGMRDIEKMVRTGLKDHERRIKILEDAERERLTETGVTRLIEARQGNTLKEWVTWTVRKVLPWLVAAIGALLGLRGVIH
jgi:hypothetical protein